MIGIIFSLGLSTAVLLLGYVQFSNSSYRLLKRDFAQEAFTNESNSCLVYGDLMARAHAIDSSESTSTIPNSSELQLGCLRSENGRCVEQHRCAISMVGGDINAKVR